MRIAELKSKISNLNQLEHIQYSQNHPGKEEEVLKEDIWVRSFV